MHRVCFYYTNAILVNWTAPPPQISGTCILECSLQVKSLRIVWSCRGLKLASPDLISHIFISTDYITLYDRKTMNEVESWVSGYAWLSWGRLQRTQYSHIPGQDLTRIFQMWSRSSVCWNTALGCMVLAVCHKQEGWAAIIPGLLCGLNVSIQVQCYSKFHCSS